MAIFASPPIWPHIDPEASRTMIALSAWAAVADASNAAPGEESEETFHGGLPSGTRTRSRPHAARAAGLRQAGGCDRRHTD